MAKKKVTQKTNDTKKQASLEKTIDQDPKLSRQSSMEDHDPVEKLQCLKSLNALLLKETVEKRRQIESLVQAKEALEAELARASTEKTGLRDELNRAGEENIALELEKALFWAFVESRLREMVDGVDGLVRERTERKSESRVLKREVNELMAKVENDRNTLSRVCEERDSIKSDFVLQLKEANLLRKKVIGLEKKERILGEQIGNLKSENEGLLEEKKNRDELIEAAIREKDDLQRNLKEKTKEVEDLNRDIEGIVRAKDEVEKEKTLQKAKTIELEMELGKLNEIVLNTRKEEQLLRSRVFHLEKSCDEKMKKEKVMAIVIDALVKEKTLKESELEKLMMEKNSVVKQVEMEYKEKEKMVDALSRKKSELEERIVNREAELVELNREVSELRDVVLTLQKDCKDQEVKNEGLIKELTQLRDALTQVELKRDNAEKDLDGEKKNGLNLRSKVLKMEKRVEETNKELEKIRNEREGLVTRKKEMENQFESLKNEKESLENDLVEAKQAIDALKAKLESAGINSERALAMLKSTASLLYQSENSREDGIVGAQKLEKEIQPYVAELEAIKKAFRNRDKLVEEMKKEVESMKHSVEQGHKRNSFWTVVSSVTTLLAAASVAYVARVR